MKLASIDSGDLVEVSKGGRRFYAKVTAVESGVVRFEPVGRGVSYRHASAREVIDHWRHARRRRRPGEPEDAGPPAAQPRAQLSLAGRGERPPEGSR